MTSYYYFKPFSFGSIGGTVVPVSKQTAKSIIRKQKMKITPDKYGYNEIGVRRFKNDDKRTCITFYTFKHTTK